MLGASSRSTPAQVDSRSSADDVARGGSRSRDLARHSAHDKAGTRCTAASVTASSSCQDGPPRAHAVFGSPRGRRSTTPVATCCPRCRHRSGRRAGASTTMAARPLRRARRRDSTAARRRRLHYTWDDSSSCGVPARAASRVRRRLQPPDGRSIPRHASLPSRSSRGHARNPPAPHVAPSEGDGGPGLGGAVERLDRPRLADGVGAAEPRRLAAARSRGPSRRARGRRGRRSRAAALRSRRRG